MNLIIMNIVKKVFANYVIACALSSTGLDMFLEKI